ncbi:MAG: hypothetical protein ABIH26_06220 [Candidatus Eisenbacteria bacterium]
MWTFFWLVLAISVAVLGGKLVGHGLGRLLWEYHTHKVVEQDPATANIDDAADMEDGRGGES